SGAGPAADDGGDPDRRERRGAALRRGVVAVDAEPLADRDGALAVLGEVDADAGQRVVHRPLRLGCGRAQLGLDPVEERGQVQALRALAYTLGGEAPVGARGPRVRVVLPGQA